MQRSKGAVLLETAMKKLGTGAIAQQANVSRQLLSLWSHSERVPGTRNAIKLRDALGIPIDSWLEEEEEGTT